LVALVGIVVVVLALGYVLGVLPSRQQGNQAAVASAPSAVDTAAVPVVDYMGTVYAQTQLPTGVQMVQELAQFPRGPIEHFEAVYFHRTHRCSGCLRAEDLIRRTVAGSYADRIQNGEMVLRVENYEEPEDPALVERYGAGWSSLHFGVAKGGVFYIYPVESIWLAGGDDAKFMEILRGEIDSVFAGQ
jgi:hypothetical protein